MTNPHQQAQPCHHTTTGDEIDVVPGTPPVPITVWRTPSDEPGPHLGPRLAARLLAAYTHTGDTIYDTTGDPVLRQTATTTGRHYHTSSTSRRSSSQVQPVALVVTAWPRRLQDHAPTPPSSTNSNTPAEAIANLVPRQRPGRQ
jgi:hypothetical protein